MKPVSTIIIGAGNRGTGYADYIAEHPDEGKVVAVAEPRDWYRNTMAKKHHLDKKNVYNDWKELAARDRFADVVFICTQDALHTEPAIAFAEKGYHILLEKPMAPTEAECQNIVAAVKKQNSLFAVCHVLRYTPYTQKLKAILDTGRIGEIVSIQHLEPVGYWHQAHSFVRGNWRNEKESAFMLLAKSCHDIDWIRYIMDEPCLRVHSFGGLKHFRQSEKPANASNRCLDCPVEKECPYSACKIYLDRIRNGETGWPADVLTPEVTEESIIQALKEGPYGRCVYRCDNDVVDHQVVNLEFAGNKSATFTMTAFTRGRGRETRIFGTKGEINGDSSKIEIFDFKTDETEVIDTTASEMSVNGGHGGGDFGLMQSFLAAVRNNDSGKILSGPQESLETHLTVFAAERSRHQRTVEEVKL